VCVCVCVCALVFGSDWQWYSLYITFYLHLGFLLLLAQHLRGAHDAGVRLLDQANVECPSALGILQRFAIIREADRVASASDTHATSRADEDDADPVQGSVTERVPSERVHSAFTELCSSPLLDMKHLKDAVELALEAPILSSMCLLAALQALRARYSAGRPVDVDICSFKVVRFGAVSMLQCHSNITAPACTNEHHFDQHSLHISTSSAHVFHCPYLFANTTHTHTSSHSGNSTLVANMQVLRALRRFDLLDVLADEVADEMRDSSRGAATCTPAQRDLILHVWATASSLIAHPTTPAASTTNGTTTDDSTASPESVMTECRVWLKLLAKMPRAFLDECEVSVRTYICSCSAYVCAFVSTLVVCFGNARGAIYRHSLRRCDEFAGERCTRVQHGVVCPPPWRPRRGHEVGE
jgi:hypothetical protein